MRLSQLAQVLDAEQAGLPGDPEVLAVECRASACVPGTVFFAIEEYLEYNIWINGGDLLADAISAGACAVVVKKPRPNLTVPQLVVPEPRRALADAARFMQGAPDEQLKVVGVTGTNGKTTTVRLLEHLFHKALGSGASMGTLGVFVNGDLLEASDYTTELAQENYRRLARLRDRGVRAVAMEVSSHALHLGRVDGLRFAAAVVTNVRRDHVDFHGSEEAYQESKRKLMDHLSPGAAAVLNRDDPHFDSFRQRAIRAGAEVWSYGQHPESRVRVEIEACRPQGSRFRLIEGETCIDVSTGLVGRFQVFNLTAGFATGRALGLASGGLVDAFGTFQRVPGRMEPVPLQRGVTAIVDYAHNPDGLENLLANCRELNPRRLLVVFGCGGDRDRGKRPLMGGIALRLADRVYVTSDNPRTEDPQRIIEDILEGCGPNDSIVVDADRRQAILRACEEAEKGDLVVVAGKGHEDYQLIGHTKHPFSDFEVLRSVS